MSRDRARQTLLLGLLFVGCTAGRTTVTHAQATSEFLHCDSVPETRLFPQQTLEGLEGRYRLVLVKTDGWRKPNGTFTGRLWLWRASPSDSNAAGRHPEPGDRSLYFGTTDIDPGPPEWYTEYKWPKPDNPTRDSVDSMHPPILGFAYRGVDEKGPWFWFVLAIGSLSNHRDRGGGLDGMGIGLTVQRVDARGVFGNWDRFGIVKTGSGYFCAYRDSPK